MPAVHMPVEEAVRPVEIAHPGQQAAFDERIFRRGDVREGMLRAAASVPPDLMPFFTQLVGKLQIVEPCLWAVPVISVAICSLGIVSQGVVHL